MICFFLLEWPGMGDRLCLRYWGLEKASQIWRRFIYQAIQQIPLSVYHARCWEAKVELITQSLTLNSHRLLSILIMTPCLTYLDSYSAGHPSLGFKHGIVREDNSYQSLPLLEWQTECLTAQSLTSQNQYWQTDLVQFCPPMGTSLIF